MNINMNINININIKKYLLGPNDGKTVVRALWVFSGWWWGPKRKLRGSRHDDVSRALILCRWCGDMAVC